ncbi:hypothetical protein [Streptomyces sp. NPDC051561]|uniref:hypothetical protein n=1 Tax=Streptomyces sp. NPDC051561 TaxID=3365658 RepID=UPI0037A85992
MVHTAALSASVTVALCGALTLGPAAVASPEARTAPSAPASAAQPADDGTKDREKVASAVRTVTKFGAASQKTGKLAGLAVNGEKDPQKLAKAKKESDKSLDNLLAIIPGGSPANPHGRAATARADLKSSVALIKADTTAMMEAALKADIGAAITAGGTFIVHLGQMAVSIFLESGLSTVKDILPTLPVDPAGVKIPGLPGGEAAGHR